MSSSHTTILDDYFLCNINAQQMQHRQEQNFNLHIRFIFSGPLIELELKALVIHEHKTNSVTHLIGTFGMSYMSRGLCRCYSRTLSRSHSRIFPELVLLTHCAHSLVAIDTILTPLVILVSGIIHATIAVGYHSFTFRRCPRDV
jgi:hypothetical protein